MRRGMLTLAVCSAAVLITAAAGLAGQIVRVGQKANGTTVTLHKGDKLRVSLAATPGTGYSWHVLAADRSVVKPAGSRYVPRRPIRPGSGGTAILSFTAVAPGRTRLKLGYVQAGRSRADKRFGLTIVVKR